MRLQQESASENRSTLTPCASGCFSLLEATTGWRLGTVGVDSKPRLGDRRWAPLEGAHGRNASSESAAGFSTVSTSANRETESIPRAAQISAYSITSKRRSPISYFDTYDCGFPRLWARSACVRPVASRAARRRLRSAWLRASWRVFKIRFLASRIEV